MTVNSSIKQVSAAIALQDKKVLIARRGPSEKLAGLWEFPGGKVECNETVFECVEREIQEELGVRCSAKKLFTTSLYQYDSGAINLIAIIVELESTNFTLSVHDKIEWCDIKLLDDFSFAPADVSIVEELKKCHL